MANANTEHSKCLRAIGSKKWRQENEKQLLFCFSPKDHNLIDIFKSIPASNNIERFKMLIEAYFAMNYDQK